VTAKPLKRSSGLRSGEGTARNTRSPCPTSPATWLHEFGLHLAAEPVLCVVHQGERMHRHQRASFDLEENKRTRHLWQRKRALPLLHIRRSSLPQAPMAVVKDVRPHQQADRLTPKATPDSLSAPRLRITAAVPGSVSGITARRPPPQPVAGGVWWAFVCLITSRAGSLYPESNS
jgi:hypothetical protein